AFPSFVFYFFFSSRRRHTRCLSDWSSDVCSSDLPARAVEGAQEGGPGAAGGAGARGGAGRHPPAIPRRAARGDLPLAAPAPPGRSEERRVGKECGSRWSAED